MNTIHIILIFLLVFISSIMWIVSLQQYDTMMSSMMMFYNPVGLSLFTLIWTAGMAAMMFPAIAPMVLLYDKLIKSNNISSNNGASGIEEKGKSSSPIVGKEEEQQRQEISKKSSSWSPYPFKIILFVGSYLAVWALTGIAILIGWSIPMNYFFSIEASSSTTQHLDIVFGALLIISGLSQFSPLNTTCLGYCESPMSFFIRRWIRGGRWIARSAGIAFMVLGVLALLGILDIPTGGMEEVSKDNTPVEKDNGMNMMEMNMGNNENDHR